MMYARVHVGVRQERVTSCTQRLAYISSCGTPVSLSAFSGVRDSKCGTLEKSWFAPVGQPITFSSAIACCILGNLGKNDTQNVCNFFRSFLAENIKDYLSDYL